VEKFALARLLRLGPGFHIGLCRKGKPHHSKRPAAGPDWMNEQPDRCDGKAFAVERKTDVRSPSGNRISAHLDDTARHCQRLAEEPRTPMDAPIARLVQPPEAKTGKWPWTGPNGPGQALAIRPPVPQSPSGTGASAGRHIRHRTQVRAETRQARSVLPCASKCITHTLVRVGSVAIPAPFLLLVPLPGAL